MEELRYGDTVEIQEGFYRGFKGIVTDHKYSSLEKEKLYKVDSFVGFSEWFLANNLKKVVT